MSRVPPDPPVSSSHSRDESSEPGPSGSKTKEFKLHKDKKKTDFDTKDDTADASLGKDTKGKDTKDTSKADKKTQESEDDFALSKKTDDTKDKKTQDRDKEVDAALKDKEFEELSKVFEKEKGQFPEKGKEKDALAKDEKKKEAEEAREKVAMGQFFQTADKGIKTEQTPEKVTSPISAAEAKTAIDQISTLIKQMVETMYVGKVEGKDVVSIDLKTTNQVPAFLNGANLTITQLERGTIAINFTNLSETNLEKAVSVMEERTGDLEKLVRDLEAKNIVVAELNVGHHSVALPHVEPLAPSPFTAQAPTSEEGYREGGERGGGGGRQGGREGGKEREKR